MASISFSFYGKTESSIEDSSIKSWSLALGSLPLVQCENHMMLVGLFVRERTIHHLKALNGNGDESA